jgi:hypothetical protein
MKKKGKIRIKIEFEQEDAQIQGHEMTIDMLDGEMLDLDACEQKLLSGTYETMRQALSSHFSNQSKKKD